jgi:hypothetical protein
MATRSVATRSNRPISRARTAAEEIVVRRTVTPADLLRPTTLQTGFFTASVGKVGQPRVTFPLQAGTGLEWAIRPSHD